MCLVEQIPPYKDQPAHQHIDMVYVARPNGGEVTLNNHETDGCRWFGLNDIEYLRTDDEIYSETKKTVRLLLTR